MLRKMKVEPAQFSVQTAAPGRANLSLKKIDFINFCQFFFIFLLLSIFDQLLPKLKRIDQKLIKIDQKLVSEK